MHCNLQMGCRVRSHSILLLLTHTCISIISLYIHVSPLYSFLLTYSTFATHFSHTHNHFTFCMYSCTYISTITSLTMHILETIFMFMEYACIRYLMDSSYLYLNISPPCLDVQRPMHESCMCVWKEEVMSLMRESGSECSSFSALYEVDGELMQVRACVLICYLYVLNLTY